MKREYFLQKKYKNKKKRFEEYYGMNPNRLVLIGQAVEHNALCRV